MAPPVGIIEPLVVRPGKKAARFEIVAGERRWRAAKIAGLSHVPVVVRELTDEQVLEIQVIENEKRKDIHALEQSDAFVAWQRLNPSLTTKKLAERIGMSERYVQNLLHYQKLVPAVREAFYDNRITAGHADLLVRLKPELQVDALAACWSDDYDVTRDDVEASGLFAGEEPTKKRQGVPVRRLVSVRDLDLWIKTNVKLDVVRDAAFFPELREVVTPPAKGEPPRPTLLEVSDTYEFYGPGHKGPKPLTRPEFKVVEDGKRCPSTQRAVVVLGPRRGRLLEVCADKHGCKVHWKQEIADEARGHGSSTEKSAKRSTKAIEAEKREAEQRRQARERDELLRAVANRAVKAFTPPAKPTPAAVAILLHDQNERSWADMVRGAVHNALLYGQITVDTKTKIKLLKPLGIDLAKLIAEAERAAKAPAEPKPAKRRVTMGDLGRKRGRRDGRRNGASTARRGPRKAGAKK
jgi:ParB family chromosome partitioning protein